MKLLEMMLLIVLSAGIISCDKGNEIEGTLMKFQTLDGTNCEFILTLQLEDESRILDPLNIDDFAIIPSNGLEVNVEFEESENGISECQFADPVIITSITLK